MNLFIDSQSTALTLNAESWTGLIDRLERLGYEPLIRKAAQTFCSVFGGASEDVLLRDEVDDEEAERDLDLIRRRLLNLEKLGYAWGIDHLRTGRAPDFEGELFFSDDGAGILFLTLVSLKKSTDESKTELQCQLRAGFIGDQDNKAFLKEFVDAITRALDEMDVESKWARDAISSKTFDEFAAAADNSVYKSANALPEKEMRAAKALEPSSARDVAMMVRRSGVILAKELLKQKAEQAADIIKHVDSLLQVDLLHQEYVVICSKTGAHVNRVESREIIEQMSRLGVLCSCGKPISEEQIEGLLSADPMLNKMLDSNYWMTTSVIRLLNTLNIPSEKILVNCQDERDDVQMLVDVDGTLVLLDLRDDEFSMGNAYDLGSRIAIHRPKLAMIVTTRGIASEVKEHFKRVKPEAQMVYVANLLQLEATLKKVVEGVRTMRTRAWLSCFQTMLSFPLHTVLLPKLQGGSKLEIPHVVSSVQLQPEPADAAATLSTPGSVTR